jgi:hypothetical protein
VVEVAVPQREASATLVAELFLEVELAVAVRIAQGDDAAGCLRIDIPQRDEEVAVRRHGHLAADAELSATTSAQNPGQLQPRCRDRRRATTRAVFARTGPPPCSRSGGDAARDDSFHSLSSMDPQGP